MCEPMTILAIGSAAMSAAGQQQAAKAQTASNQRQHQNTLTASNANYAQTALEQQQQGEAAQQKLEENRLNAQSAAATTRVAAGENGITGLSVDALLADVGVKQNRYDTSVMTNLDRASGAIQSQRENIYANAASTINGLKAPAMPDYFGTALRIGTEVKKYRDSISK